MSIRSAALLFIFLLTGIIAAQQLSANSSAANGTPIPADWMAVTAVCTTWHEYEMDNRIASSRYCNDTTEQEFVNYSINGTAVLISNTTVGKITQSPDDIYPNSILIEATGGADAADLHFRFNNEQVVAGGNRPLYHVMNGVIGFPLMPDSAIVVHITEYGNPGEFISGNFSGTVRNFNSPNVVYTISCAFRVRRQL